ncbi:MAG: hypothetical protein GY910_15965 [bacterium]|nr:hypothetical protein [bacterium]
MRTEAARSGIHIGRPGRAARKRPAPDQRLAIGEVPDFAEFAPSRDRCIANRHFFAENRRLTGIEGADEIRRQPWIAKFGLWHAKGDKIPPTTSHAERFGVFVVVGDDREEVQSRVDRVYRTLQISVG